MRSPSLLVARRFFFFFQISLPYVHDQIAQLTGAGLFGISLRPPRIIFVFARPLFGAQRRENFNIFSSQNYFPLSLKQAGIIK